MRRHRAFLTAIAFTCVLLLFVWLALARATAATMPGATVVQRADLTAPSPMSADPQPLLAGTNPVTLAAVFASWYGYDVSSPDRMSQCAGGLRSYHWNDTPNTGGVVYTPTLGWYCSADPAVVHWQLDRIQEAGIGALFVSWWGWGDGDLDGDEHDDPYPIDGHADRSINLGLQALLTDIISNSRPISVALIVEPFPMTQAGLNVNGLTTAETNLIWDHVESMYYGNSLYRNLWFRWRLSDADPRILPLVISFDPLRLPMRDGYAVRRWTGGPKTSTPTQTTWDWFFAPQQPILDRISDDGVAFVFPRFDEYFAWIGWADYIKPPVRRIDEDLTKGKYEEQWQALIDNRDQVKLIVLYSWNLYGEQAHIEPSAEGRGPAPVGWSYVQKTRDYYTAFTMGCPRLHCAYLPGLLAP